MKGILIYIGTTLGLILFMEFFLQITEISLPNPIAVDSKIGKVLQPDSRINLIKEGLYLGKVNEYGYLGPGYPKERKANTVRIALMGDSYVEAYQLFEKFNFRTVIEDELNKTSDKKVEVLNFGRSGMSFGTMYTYYENFVNEFSPDIVLFIIGQDDFVIKNQSLFPGLEINSEGELVFNKKFKESYLFKLREKYNFIFNFSTFDLIKKSAKLVEEGYAAHILFDKLNPELLFNTGKKLTAEIEQTDEGKVADANSIAVLSKIFSNFNLESSTTFAIAARGELANDYVKLIQENQIHYLKLYKYVSSLKTPDFDPNYWKASNKYGHWNHKAHQFIGKYLANYIRSELMTD